MNWVCEATLTTYTLTDSMSHHPKRWSAGVHVCSLIKIQSYVKTLTEDWLPQDLAWQKSLGLPILAAVLKLHWRLPVWLYQVIQAFDSTRFLRPHWPLAVWPYSCLEFYRTGEPKPMQSVVSSYPDTVVIEADHTTPVTMELWHTRSINMYLYTDWHWENPSFSIGIFLP